MIGQWAGLLSPRTSRLAATGARLADSQDSVELSEFARDLATINVTTLTGDEPDLAGFDSIRY